MSDITNDNKIKCVTGGLMFLVAVGIIYFAFNSKPEASTSLGTLSGSDSSEEFSVDNPDNPFKTLGYAEAVQKLKQADGKQMFYIGCRDCGYCMNLEQVMSDFLANHKDKNDNRDLIYRIEAGYTCVPGSSDKVYADYAAIFDFLVENDMAEEDSQKRFGTPQFFYVENGKIVDDLNNYGRSVDGIEQMFAEHGYRGF